MSLNVFKWRNGVLYCSFCCTRESGVKLSKVHDWAVVHDRWFHGETPLVGLERTPCCGIYGLMSHDRNCPNWVMPY